MGIGAERDIASESWSNASPPLGCEGHLTDSGVGLTILSTNTVLLLAVMVPAHAHARAETSARLAVQPAEDLAALLFVSLNAVPVEQLQALDGAVGRLLEEDGPPAEALALRAVHELGEDVNADGHGRPDHDWAAAQRRRHVAVIQLEVEGSSLKCLADAGLVLVAEGLGDSELDI